MALYAKMKGPVDYTVVGSPTIEDGIISYTSRANHIELNERLQWSTASDLEVYCRFKTPSSFPSGNCAIISTTPDSTPLIWKSSGNNVYFNLPATTFGTSATLQTETWYRVKVTGKNLEWTTVVYEDDGTILNQNTITTTAGNTSTRPISISVDYVSLPPMDAVDLNNTYIKVNNQLWFGKDFIPVKVRTNPFVKYSVVGSPTITNGVASGFSDSDYLKLSQTVPSGTAKTFEISTKFTTPDSFARTGSIIAIQTYYSYGIRLTREGSSTATLYGTSRSNSAYYSVNGIAGSISPSTTYYVKYKVDGENGTQTLSISTDNENWQHFNGEYTVGYYNDNSILWQIGYSAYGASECSIDLNNTYIKVNGQYWFQGSMQDVDTWTLHLGE